MTIPVYLAAPYDMRDQVRLNVLNLPEGIESTARWVEHTYGPDERRVAAIHDLEDVSRASALVGYVGQRGWGHALEIGYALGQGKPVYVVNADGGPADWNVFLHHPAITVCTDIHDAFALVIRDQSRRTVGARVENGGEMGTIVRCHHCAGSGKCQECNGDRVLHKPDKEPEYAIPQSQDELVEEKSSDDLLHPNSQLFRAILDEVWSLHRRKALDYGTDADPLQNLKAAEDFGVPNWIAASIRANDKVQRVKAGAQRALADGDVRMANESIIDAFRDASNYFILVEILYREWLHKQGKDRVGDGLDEHFGGPYAFDPAKAHRSLQSATGAPEYGTPGWLDRGDF